jgi:enoyl-CoA hydratase
MSEDVVLLAHDGPVSTVTFNRPKKLNAINDAVLDGLAAAIEGIAARAETRCAILTGAGDRAFIAGADISVMRSYREEDAKAFSEKGHDILRNLELLRVPVIAAVNGFALGGGCEFALACDFIHASDGARFGQPEVTLGVIPGFGGTSRLARRVGIGMARELVYAGTMIDAAEALRIGLVNRVHPADELMANVTALAQEIAARGPFAVAEAKAVLRDGEERPLEEANAVEVAGFARCFTTRDQDEGMDAFLQKRKPIFKGA